MGFRTSFFLRALLSATLIGGLVNSYAAGDRLDEIPEITIRQSDFQEELEVVPEGTFDLNLPSADENEPPADTPAESVEDEDQQAEQEQEPEPKSVVTRSGADDDDDEALVYEPGGLAEHIDPPVDSYVVCEDVCEPRIAPCLFFPSGGVWARAEYLLWATKGMDIPPLVTGGSTGVLGDEDTIILYGDETILDDMRSGFRVQIGTWLDCHRIYALEADYWTLGEQSDRFLAESDAEGNPERFRPFVNINPRLGNDGLNPPAMNDAEIVSSPGVLAGSVQVDTYSELLGTGIRFRKRMCCDTGCVTCRDACGRPHGVPRTTRLDFLVGYRYLRLDEGLSVREDLTSLLSVPEQGDFDIFDTFDTANTFNGVDLGVIWERAWGRWSVELLGKLALGNMEQVVRIRGGTTISNALSGNGEYVGGLLAQRTNIGEYQREVFAVVPELGASAGYQLTPHWRVTCGYTFLYLSRVARPGEQIDLDVNPDLFPPEFTPFAGLERPEFTFRDTDFWAQGLNIGLECRF